MYLVFLFRTIFNPVVGLHSLSLPDKILPHIVNILYFFPFAVILGELRVWLKPCFDLRKGLWLTVCSPVVYIDYSIFHRLFLLYTALSIKLLPKTLYVLFHYSTSIFALKSSFLNNNYPMLICIHLQQYARLLFVELNQYPRH